MATPAASAPSSRRLRKKVILFSALFGLLSGFVISYSFPPRYSSQSLVIVQPQTVPENMVPTLITSPLPQRLSMLQAQALASNRLRPLIERLGIDQPGEQSETVQEIRTNLVIEPIAMDTPQAAPNDIASPSGFTFTYTSSSPRRAQLVCQELTGLLLEENLRDRETQIQQTIDFLRRQVSEAKARLQEMDAPSLKRRKEAQAAPGSEGGQKMLARDYEFAQKNYADLLGQLSRAESAAQVEKEGKGEQLRVLTTASLPDAPDFPNRLLFAAWGLGAGLVLAIGLMSRRWYRQRSPQSDAPPSPPGLRRAFFGRRIPSN